MKIKKEIKILELLDVKNTYKETREKDIEIEILKEKEKLKLKGEFLYKNREKEDRLFLKIFIEGSKNDKESKELTVIMLNPSEQETKNVFIDRTITNVIKIAYENGYNQLNILNLITVLNSNSKEIKLDQIEEKNISCIKNFISKNNSDILVAWGEKIKNNTTNPYAKDLIGFLKQKNNVLTFCPNKKEFPKHPARIDFDCCKNCSEEKDFIKLTNYNFDN